MLWHSGVASMLAVHVTASISTTHHCSELCPEGYVLPVQGYEELLPQILVLMLNLPD